MARATTIKNGTMGKRDLRLVEKDGKYFGLADGKRCVEGSNADSVWLQLHDEVGKADPKYFGFTGARSRFLKFFPGGFQSDDYRSHERYYKIGPVAELFRSFNRILCAKGERLWEPNAQQSLDRKRSGLH